VPSSAYGRAFGFERLMDTLGAIVGPLTALWLLRLTHHNYRAVFLGTLVPGTTAVLSFWLLVRERPSESKKKQTFVAGLRSLPGVFRRFLLAVGIFGSGDFSHTFFILYATRMLAPHHGMARAASLAVGLYTLHNVFYAASAYVSGWLSDNVPQRKFVLASGYVIAGITAILLTTEAHRLWPLAIVFMLAGVYVGTDEALEDSLAAELIPQESHGMAFGTLAAVNAIGDFLSSLVVGFLWSAVSVRAAFSFSACLFFLGAFLILRLRR
jgi:MFS family permease